MEREKLIPAIGYKVHLVWRASSIYMTLSDVGERFMYLGPDEYKPITIVPLNEVTEITWDEITKTERVAK